ncbi:hypothetical protein LJB42_003713 [Komagataella kurtzmanii]|nr:hypothetical protein LJB42_003713 [Komagataella kurtzmanii]
MSSKTPRLKPVPYKESDLYQPLLAPQLGPGCGTTEDIPYNKRDFKYKPCRPNPFLLSKMYSTTDLPPYKGRFSYFDRSQRMCINEDCDQCTSEDCWRSVKGSLPIRQGRVYVEFKILNSEGDSHVRLGFGRREASLEAPVGYDAYGYGFRDLTGQKVHLSRPQDFMGSFGTGDTIGLLIQLADRIKIDDIDRDEIPIKYKNQLFFEQYDYVVTKPMDHLLNPVTVFGEKAIPDKDRYKPPVIQGSFIKVFVNGEPKGTAFENLYGFLPPASELKKGARDDGSLGYYPMASCFRGGKVQLNTANKPEFAPQGEKEYLMYNELYDDSKIEEYVWDLIDEVESAWLDELGL